MPVRVLERVKQGVYSRYANPGFRQYLKDYSLSPKILVEAGCHYAEDTIQLIEELDLTQIIAFEADPDAFEVAKRQLMGYRDVLLFEFGLGDKPGSAALFVNNLEPENGTSGFHFEPSNPSEWHTRNIEICTLDGILVQHLLKGEPPPQREIFLWLDVEGFEDKVLAGAAHSLKNVSVAQIEINMHDSLRKANYLEVLRIMRNSGFILVFAPLHPGFFGDAVFVHKENIRIWKKLRGLILHATMVAFHSFLYPILRKPK